MGYLIWDVDTEGGFCVLTTLQNVDKAYELTRGVSRTLGFPTDASFRMNPEFPKDVQLADNLYNAESMIVVSPALGQAIEQQQPPNIEFLPVTIYNHKGRVASSDYRIVNPLGVVDCIDQNATKVQWNSIDPNLIASCFGLQLDVGRIDPALLLFRLKYLPHVVVVRDDLAETLVGQAFSGLRFVTLDEFEF